MIEKKTKIKILKDDHNYLNYFFQKKEIDFYGHKLKMIDANVLLYCIFLKDVYWKYDYDQQLFYVISKEDKTLVKTLTKEDWSSLFKKYIVSLNLDKMIITCSNEFSEYFLKNLLTLFDKLKVKYELLQDNLDKILSNADSDEDVDISDLLNE